jgi:hypothetical protein
MKISKAWGLVVAMRVELFWFPAAVALMSCTAAPLPLPHADIPAPHYECKRENAVALDLDRFAANPETYAGRCIHARGFKIAGFFYPDLTTFYSGWGIPEPNKQIRLFGREDRTGHDFLDVRETVDLTALAYSCNELNRRFFDELQLQGLISSGRPCPSYNDRGAILLVSDWRPISGKPRRLAGPSAMAKYGQLLDVTDDGEHASQVSAVAEKWFDAVRRQDVDAFMQVTGSLEDERDDVSKLLSSNGSAVRFLFGKTVNPTIKYFLTRSPLDEPSVPIKVTSRAFGCVCRTADCTNLWPINWNDTYFDREWPYFCIEINRDSDGRFSIWGLYDLYKLGPKPNKSVAD